MDLKDQKESLDFRAPKDCWVNLGQGAKRENVVHLVKLELQVLKEQRGMWEPMV